MKKKTLAELDVLQLRCEFLFKQRELYERTHPLTKQPTVSELPDAWVIEMVNTLRDFSRFFEEHCRMVTEERRARNNARALE